MLIGYMISSGYKWERQLVSIETLSAAVGYNEPDERQRSVAITAIGISPYSLHIFSQYFVSLKINFTCGM